MLPSVSRQLRRVRLTVNRKVKGVEANLGLWDRVYKRCAAGEIPFLPGGSKMTPAHSAGAQSDHSQIRISHPFLSGRKGIDEVAAAAAGQTDKRAAGSWSGETREGWNIVALRRASAGDFYEAGCAKRKFR